VCVCCVFNIIFFAFFKIYFLLLKVCFPSNRKEKNKEKIKRNEKRRDENSARAMTRNEGKGKI
jgi:hypothetical protein